ncbi:hypothetical protein HDU96_004792, partial [Phlyctochytrium bullatum]
MSHAGSIDVVLEIARKLRLDASSTVTAAKKVHLLTLGDLGTIRILRGTKILRADDLGGPQEQLRYVQPVPGEFHYAMQFVDILFEMFWSKDRSLGTLPYFASKYKQCGNMKSIKYQQRVDILMPLWRCY